MSDKIDAPASPAEPDGDKLQAYLDDEVERVAAHFSHVLLIVGYTGKDGEPYFMTSRSGDYFAVKGLCHYWLEDDSAMATASEVAATVGLPTGDDDDDDDGEDWKKDKAKA